MLSMLSILFCEAFLVDLAGGVIVVSILLRMAGRRKLEPLDESTPVPWSDAASWDTKAIGLVLLVELVLFPIVLALLEFWSKKTGQNFFYWVAGMSLSCALSFAQCRATSGRARLTSLMILILLACSSVGAVSVLIFVDKDLTPTVGVAALIAGFAAGLALVKFGRIKKS